MSEVDAADRRTNALARTLTSAQLNWRPSQDEWSIGQCLEHLCVATEVYLPPISSALASRSHAVVPEITPGWFGRWFIRSYIEPSSVTRRGRAPKKIVPAAHVDPSVLERFRSGNDGLRTLILHAGQYDVNRIRFRNPFIPLIHFTVGTGLEILVRHQRRHLLQAERIRERPEFPGPARSGSMPDDSAVLSRQVRDLG